MVYIPTRNTPASPADFAHTARPVPPVRRPSTGNGRLRLAGWEFSRHSLERLLEMGIEPADAIEVLTAPGRIDYPCSEHGPHRGYRTVWHGDYGVAYNPANRHILTVLYNTTQEYVRPGK